MAATNLHMHASSYQDSFGLRIDYRSGYGTMSDSSLPLQPWGFIPLEIWVVSAKQEALQALRIPKNLVGNALTLHFEKTGEPVNCLSDTPVNQSIRPGQLGVALRNCPESFELLDRIFPLVRGEAVLEIHPAFHGLSS